MFQPCFIAVFDMLLLYAALLTASHFILQAAEQRPVAAQPSTAARIPAGKQLSGINSIYNIREETRKVEIVKFSTAQRPCAL